MYLRAGWLGKARWGFWSGLAATWHALGGLKHGIGIWGCCVDTSESPLVPPSLDPFLCILDKHSLARDSVFFGCVLTENFLLALARHPSCNLPRVPTLIPVGRNWLISLCFRPGSNWVWYQLSVQEICPILEELKQGLKPPPKRVRERAPQKGFLL